MNTQRETKTITTPAGKELVLKTYITARERNELRGIYLNSLKVETENNNPTIKEISGSVVEQAEKKIIELAVVSYDNSQDGIIDRLLDGTSEEYDFAVAEANKISSGNFPKAK
jgi:hypothetical protein